MGTTADAALVAGGQVVGIIPRSLLDAETPFSDPTALAVVDDIRTRKQEMCQRATVSYRFREASQTLRKPSK